MSFKIKSMVKQARLTAIDNNSFICYNNNPLLIMASQTRDKNKKGVITWHKRKKSLGVN